MSITTYFKDETEEMTSELSRIIASEQQRFNLDNKQCADKLLINTKTYASKKNDAGKFTVKELCKLSKLLGFEISIVREKTIFDVDTKNKEVCKL